MTLPNWTADGYLPGGLHESTMDELYERAVLGAPNRERRETLYMGVHTQLKVMKSIIGSGRAWIAGSLLTHDCEDTAKVIVFPTESFLSSATPEKRMELVKVVSLGDIIVNQPSTFYLDKRHAVVGLVDAVLARTSQESEYMRMFGSVSDSNGNIIQDKGIVEVEL